MGRIASCRRYFQAAENRRVTDCKLQDWKTAGLHQPSWIRSHMATFQRTLIIKKVGDLTARDLRPVEGCLRDSLGL